jgi:hypothetical protein
MTAGFQVSLSQVNAQAGGYCLSLRNLFDQIQNFQQWLAAQSDTAMEALGYSAGDLSTLRAAVADLNGLAQIYQGHTVTTGFGGTLPYEGSDRRSADLVPLARRDRGREPDRLGAMGHTRTVAPAPEAGPPAP